MFRIKAIITSLCFVIWVLPLGVFIKPYQEAIVCGGQRAICLCSHLLKKDAKGGQPMLVTPGAQKESSPGGGSHDYIFAKIQTTTSFATSSYIASNSIPQLSLFIKSIEHVPKA